MTSPDHRPGEGQRPQSRPRRTRESQPRQWGALEPGAAAPPSGPGAGHQLAEVRQARSGRDPASRGGSWGGQRLGIRPGRRGRGRCCLPGYASGQRRLQPPPDEHHVSWPTTPAAAALRAGARPGAAERRGRGASARYARPGLGGRAWETEDSQVRDRGAVIGDLEEGAELGGLGGHGDPGSGGLQTPRSLARRGPISLPASSVVRASVSRLSNLGGGGGFGPESGLGSGERRKV
ncbi:hypothetical protein DBR06_SOUSAS8310095 [Sousa chinensis]|nr:hypothetical protein DBR06_SOUSAS8310095 [Sousa chinensis]